MVLFLEIITNTISYYSFFVFACTICNEGGEYLRRLHIDWVDLIHLIMYNLSTMKKHQNHKYHHLLKDIYPFALEKRELLPLPKEVNKFKNI